MGCDWHSPEILCLPGRERVHIWRLELDSYPSETQGNAEILDAGELSRANKYRSEIDRQKYILRHTVLRNLLGYYLQAEPRDVCYTTNEFGKPALDEKFNSRLRFNLSTSGELALFAFSEERQVGIDVEKVRTDRDTVLIAERFFSQTEKSILFGLPIGQQLQGFYNCWTRKEAVVKALGQGLSLALDSFDVSLAPGDPASILDARNVSLAALTFTLRDLSAAPGYSAAVAVEGKGWQVECWQFFDKVTIGG